MIRALAAAERSIRIAASGKCESKMQNLLDLALKIATNAHAGQVDKAGKAYIEHPKHVAALMETDEEKMTALLHDVIEDTDISLDDLRAASFPDPVIEAIDILTRKKGSDYFSYLDCVKHNQLARAVKMADLTHNSDLSRIPDPTGKNFQRVEKYKKALEYLK